MKLHNLKGKILDFSKKDGIITTAEIANQFDISWLANNIAAGGSVLMFPSPVLVLFQQPLSVTVTTRSAITGGAAAAKNQTVVVDLIGELAIQKAPPGYRGV